MNAWLFLFYMLDLLFGAFTLAFVGYFANLPFWVVMIGAVIWGYFIGRDISKRINNKKGK